jgi:hypothetical protein
MATATGVGWHGSEEQPVNVGSLGPGNLRQVSHLQRDSVRGWSPNTSWLRSPTFLTAGAIGVVTLVLRLLYAATAATDNDGIQYVVGSGRFDVSHDAPQPPGSWLYVATGHALHVVTGLSPVSSLVLVAAVISAAAAALTCVAGTALGGRFVGIASGALVASTPVSWFAGSTVSTYSIDAFLGALLIVLARRARPYRAHGTVAVLALGLGAGVRLSVVPIFALLVVIAVVASVRTVGQLLATVAVGVASVAAWFIPMVVIQPGGAHEWLHAVHVLFSGTARLSSVFVAPTSGVLTNLGTLAAWSLLSLGPVFVLGVMGILVVTGAHLVTGKPGGNISLRIWSRATEPADRIERPWYQSTGAILTAALLPALAYLTLWHFTAGGDVLSFLVPATVLLLLPVARLLHHRAWTLRRVTAVVATVFVAVTVVVNMQRFISPQGILPASVATDHPGLWLSQARYQSPYTDTADAIRKAQSTAVLVAGLRAVVHPATDVVVCISAQNGVNVSRVVGAELPDTRVAVVAPLRTMEYGGLIYRQRSSILQVGPGGHAVVLTDAPLPALASLAAGGLATETTTHVHGYNVWLVAPGATLLGVTITAVPGPRLLGGPVN